MLITGVFNYVRDNSPAISINDVFNYSFQYTFEYAIAYVLDNSPAMDSPPLLFPPSPGTIRKNAFDSAALSIAFDKAFKNTFTNLLESKFTFMR